MGNVKFFFAKWIDPFIYNLLYPACFGNIIYELFFNKDSFNNPLQFAIGITIMMYYIIDFMHLYVDMNKIVNVFNRNIAYHICDIATPILFFASFVFLEREEFAKSILCVASIPFFLSMYKWKNPNNRKYFIILSTISIITILFVLIKKIKLLMITSYINLLAMHVALLVVLYSYYVFFFYKIHVMSRDKEIYKDEYDVSTKI